MSSRQGPYVVLVGNLSDGYQAFGPYPDIELAFEAHGGDECWMMQMQTPIIFEPSPEDVVDIFDYKKNWQPGKHRKRNK
jgi:hypothetical protein